MWQNYIFPTDLQDAIEHLTKQGDSARIVAGGTDLLLEMERGVRKGINTLIDLSRIPDLDQIELGVDGLIHLGPLVTHNQVVASALLREKAFPLVQAAYQVGSPQIRNRGTVAGNVITASPANDTITPLFALGAVISLQSPSGIRKVPIREFHTGVRKNVIQPGEILVDISFTPLPESSRGIFIKYALRKAQAISLLNLAIVIDVQGEKIQKCAITLGAVAPTIIHAADAERYLIGKTLSDSIWNEELGELVVKPIRPISDIRSSADYRNAIVKVMAKRGLQSLAAGTEREGIPENPVILATEIATQEVKKSPILINNMSAIRTTVNGKEYEVKSGQSKTLLRFLREELLLTGVKEGCGEGECGACTIHLDGKAVMACLVPAPRAHGAVIQTIEGVSPEGELHPVQQAMIDEGAVQCGYCTPGIVMSAMKLLDEVPHPDRDQVKQAITGNLCRCTGYYKIVDAIEKASEANV
jgi:xanthine dehydrogenase iron-sulfur cluster and FAD-binding subunit A